MYLKLSVVIAKVPTLLSCVIPVRILSSVNICIWFQVMDNYGSGRPSVMKTTRLLLDEDGWRGFYRGFGPRFLNMSLWGTSMIVTYELISKPIFLVNIITCRYWVWRLLTLFLNIPNLQRGSRWSRNNTFLTSFQTEVISSRSSLPIQAI